MSDYDDWNKAIIDEFRENEGKVGGQFEGAPMVLVHHRGRRSGKDSITPMMYLSDEQDPGVFYVFASKAGAPTNPDWYYNLTTAGEARVKLGTDSFEVAVTEVTGAERDRIYAVQSGRNPGFAEYEGKTKGVRTIPVLALRRS